MCIRDRHLRKKKFDSRVYVIRDSAPHFFIRVNSPDKLITNYSQGAEVIHHPETGIPKEIIAQMKEQAVRASRAMNSQFMGVDIMSDGCMENTVVVEVQTFTDFPDKFKFYLQRYMVSEESGLFV